MRMRIRSFGVVFTLALGAALSACEKNSAQSSGSSAEASASASASPSSSAAAAAASASAADAASSADAEAELIEEENHLTDELQAHHRHHHQGFVGFVIMAVETLGIAPDQQTAVDGIRKDFHTKMKPLREANTAVLDLLADGIAAGTIDKAKVDAAVARAGTAAAAVHAATPDVLNHLHAVLRPEQRAALVDKVDAQWMVWREANSAEQMGDGGSGPDRHIAHVAKDIGLTSDQVDKLRANLDATKDVKKPFDPVAVDAYLKALDEAFVAEAFDAKKLPAAASEDSRVVSWGAERMARFHEALAPVLTPDQRTQVADKLRQRAEHTPKEKP
jgi:Spy/CpxP family protein refolding chaperone